MSNVNEEVFPFAKKVSFVVFLGGILATYSHFAGYTFLKGFIEGLGLGSIEFSLTPLESVYQTSQFLKHITNNVVAYVNAYFSMDLKTFLMLCALGGTYAWVFSTFVFKKSNKPTEDNDKSNKPLRWYFKIILFPASFGLGMTTFILLLLMLLGISSLLFLIAFDSGKDSAINRLSNEVCISLSEFKKNKPKQKLKGRRAGCTVLQDKAGNKLSGLVLFQSSEMKIFMTNNMTILFDKANEVVHCAPIVDISVDETITSEVKEGNPCHNVVSSSPQETG